MYPSGGPRQPEFDFEQIKNRILAYLGPVGKRLGGTGVGALVGGVIALIVIIWLASGVYTISPGENATLQRFGKVCRDIVGLMYGRGRDCDGHRPPLVVAGTHWQ